MDPDVAPRLLAIDTESCRTDCEDNSLLGLCVVDEKGDVVYQVSRVEGMMTVGYP